MGSWQNALHNLFQQDDLPVTADGSPSAFQPFHSAHIPPRDKGSDFFANESAPPVRVPRPRKMGGEGVAKRRPRARNWDLQETICLVNAKRIEWEKYECATSRARADNNANRKWEQVGVYMQEHGYSGRDGKGCRNKWENLLSEFKAIKDWDQRSGVAPYTSMSTTERNEEGLPKQFHPELYECLDGLYSNRPMFNPPGVFDSSTPTVGTEPSSPDEVYETQHSSEPTVRGDREPGSSGRKRKSSHASNVEAAIREGNSLFVASFEKQQAERDILERERVALEREKIALETEKVQDEKADRRAYIHVLGSLASSFEKIANKMSG